jgi:hypothetical protein
MAFSAALLMALTHGVTAHGTISNRRDMLTIMLRARGFPS